MSNLASSLYKTCCRWLSLQFLYNLAYLSLISPFPFLKNGLLTATLSLRPFLMRLLQTVHNSAERSNASLRSSIRSLMDFSFFLRGRTFRYCSYPAHSFFFNACYFFCSPLLSSFLVSFWGHTEHHAKMCHALSNSLKTTLLVQKYFFMPVKLLYLWYFHSTKENFLML